MYIAKKWTVIQEATCRYCGRKFVPAVEHALKDNYGIYCKPTCYLKGANLKKSSSRRVIGCKGDTEEIFSSAKGAAEMVGCEPKSIRKSCLDGTSCKGYLWRYEG